MKCIEVVALKKMDIVYEDKYLIIVNKPSGIFSISTLKEKEKTMYHEVYEYLRKKNQRVFIVHRLDKDTSGLMLFAKNVDVKNYFQDNWDKVTRKYVAVVEGVVKEDSKTIKNYLKENKNFVTYSDSNGKLAITKYKKIRSNKMYSLLEIEILTGRKNQIRFSMMDIGHSIVGDKKYGSLTNPIHRLCLVATSLTFIHPVYKKEMTFNINIPKEFLSLV